MFGNIRHYRISRPDAMSIVGRRRAGVVAVDPFGRIGSPHGEPNLTQA
jgi:hypothetical protein